MIVRRLLDSYWASSSGVMVVLSFERMIRMGEIILRGCAYDCEKEEAGHVYTPHTRLHDFNN